MTISMSRKVALWLLTGTTLLFALPVGWMAYSAYAPHLLLNETTRRLYQYREVGRGDGDVNMIPGFFVGGEPKQEIERELTHAGLEAWNTPVQDLPSGAASIQVFRLAAGSRGVVCGNELYLTLTYDASDRLRTATIRQGGVCL